ncbi:MAG: phosphoenolpyruvate--protein phosphotransferase [Spirochaetota bacterium]
MQTNHVKMLYDIGELNSLFAKSVNIETFLQKIVEMVARHMNTDVCSIFLYDEASKEIVLKATIGLKPESVNNVKLKLGEGLVGLSLLDAKPIYEKSGPENPNYKFYPGINEELYLSFLAVPILRGNIKIGVLVVQKTEGKTFEEQDILALRVTASQLASMIENIKFIITSPQKPDQVKKAVNLEKLKFIKGKSASEGFAYSEVTTVDVENVHELMQDINFTKKYSIKDFDKAIKATEQQLEMLQKKVEEKLSDAASLIFSAHLLILKDEVFTGSMRKLIENGENPPFAIIKKYKEYKDIFSESQNQLIREKILDIEDLTKRIINNLLYRDTIKTRYKDRIAVVREIFPSELLIMSAEDIKGIILVSGGVSSHVSILARSLKIPVVIADSPELLELPDKTMAIIDAELGNVYINPSKEIVIKYNEQKKARVEISKEENLNAPSVTTEGIKINLMVNINLLSDLKNIQGVYNDGIGLYRTEFPFIIRNDFPTEEEQFVIYKKLVQDMDNKPVTFRTLDIGGDKVLSYYEVAHEENPFLGMRSIRFSLTHREIFKQQIRAILRAGYKSNIKIMFPMISSLDEFLISRDIVYDCIRELNKQSITHISNPEIGMMVEIPSLVSIIDDIAKEADFLSIGTNDLIQYTLAVDRTNEKVADLYIPHHPAILNSLKTIADAGKKYNIEVSICGDMASNINYIPFLLGIGILNLSVDSMYLPKVKRVLSKISIKDAEKFAALLLSKSKISEIEQILNSINN